MIKGYFIRLGDKTDCGGEVKEADDRVIMFGVAHARVGDGVSCGKDGKLYEIRGGVSHVESHGRLVAGTLDSFSTCPCGSKLIASDFTASYSNDDGSGSRAFNRAVQTGSGSDRVATATTQPTDVKHVSNSNTPLWGASTSPIGCNHPDQMEELASYIADEMNRNVHDPAVLEMRALIDYDPVLAAREYMELPWYARLTGTPNFGNIAKAKMVAAATIWTKKVGQNQDWDHKPKLQAMYNGVVRHKQGRYDYYYDIWSNIHYGYVGVAGGLSESVLLDGAGAEQIPSDTWRKVNEWATKPKEEWKLPGPHPTASPWTELRSWDDVADRVSISLGVKLAKSHPQGRVTATIIMNEVLAIAPENWGDGVREHVCR